MTSQLKARLIGIPLLSLAITVSSGDQTCYLSFNNFIFSYFFTTIMTTFLWVGNIFIFNSLHLKYPELEQTFKRSFLLVLTCVIYTLSTYSFLEILLASLLHVELKFEDYFLGVKVSFIATTLVSLCFEAHFFFHQWKKTFLNAEKLKKESVQAQLESLRNQVNPHFLFNSLNTLLTIIPEDQSLATDFTLKLSNVYRYLLTTRDQEVVTLEKEIEFIRSYIFLLKVRFEKGLNVTIDIPDRLLQLTIPPVSLQLLLENAIKHNIVSNHKPLSIIITCYNKEVIISNNLQPKQTREESTGVGLENIKLRYALLSELSIAIKTEEDKFIVHLPLLDKQE